MNSNIRPIRTRFAPSPTGYLHRGHALSALWSHRRAKSLGGAFLIRIEDIDHTRRRPEMIQDVHRVLDWLGLEAEDEIVHQHERRDLYHDALRELQKLDAVYPCTCSRAEILAVTGSAQSPYPGTCRRKRRDKAPSSPTAWRLNWQAIKSGLAPSALAWTDMTAGRQSDAWASMEVWGDVIVARRDIGTSYHLAHVVDDHHQGISHVTRGQDLFDQTAIHRVLQCLFGYGEPLYDHHPLVLQTEKPDAKLSKRDGSTSLMTLAQRGLTRQALIQEFAEVLRAIPSPAAST